MQTVCSDFSLRINIGRRICHLFLHHQLRERYYRESLARRMPNYRLRERFHGESLTRLLPNCLLLLVAVDAVLQHHDAGQLGGAYLGR